MIDVKVLGTGCPRCVRLELLVAKAVKQAADEVNVEVVSDAEAIMAYGVLSSPALIVNGQVKSAGRVPDLAEIVGWLEEPSVSG